MKFKASSYILGSSIAVKCIGIITGVLLARLLGPDGRGEVASFAFWPPFIAGILGLSLNTTANYHIARLRNNYHVASIKALMGTIVATAILTAPLSYVILIFVDDDRFSNAYIFLAMLYVAAEIVRPALLGIISGLKQYKNLSILNLVTPLIYLTSLVFFFIIDKITIDNAIFSVVLASILSAIVQIVRFRRGLSYPKRYTIQILKTSARYHPSRILESVRGNIDKLVIVSLLEVNQIGIYFVASTFASAPFSALQQVFATQLLTDFSAISDKKEALKKLFRTLLYSFGIGILVWLGLLLTLPLIIPLLVGEGYLDVPHIATILAFAFSILLSTTVITTYIQSTRNAKILFSLELSFIISFLLVSAIIRPHTAYDIAYCVSFGYIINFIVGLLIIFRRSKSS